MVSSFGNRSQPVFESEKNSIPLLWGHFSAKVRDMSTFGRWIFMLSRLVARLPFLLSDKFLFLCCLFLTKLENPVTVEGEGIKLKPEKMIIGQLYHCICEGKVFLFFKDEEEMLHCYEVQDKAAVKEIFANQSDIEKILLKYSQNE
jgi:hypothetical protein